MTWLNIQHYSREARNGRNFCRTPNFSTFTIFQLSCKKIMSETFLGQKLCHGVKSRLNPVVTFWEGLNFDSSHKVMLNNYILLLIEITTGNKLFQGI